LVAATTRRIPLSDEPPSRRSVHDFCKHYGLSRNQFLTARDKAKIKPKAYDSMLSAKDQDALLRYLSARRQNDQMMRRIREQPRVTKQFVPAPAPAPSIDYEAEIDRIADSLAKWRTTLVELGKGHDAVDGKGRCRRCHVEAPCPTKQTLARLDNELVEQIAVADSGEPDEGSTADVTVPEAVLERHLQRLYNARNRWRTALTRLTIDHMLEDERGRCTQCRVAAPCDTKKTVTRINRGIVHQIERFASMDDGELEVALGDRRKTGYFLDEDDDWDAM
jgi:hypothetical protein